MMRNLKHTFLLAGLSAWLLASTAWAQQPGAQYVDSLEEHQQRIEGLLRERLTAMLPTGNYVALPTRCLVTLRQAESGTAGGGP